MGIEPSLAAIAAASDVVRPMLRQGMFSEEILNGASPNLICSFMTLEHMDDPAGFIRSAYSVLKPGGMLGIVVHNWQSFVNRALGLRSPIIDIEHLQLFNVSSINSLLRRFGFENISTESIYNRYPIRYWVRLSPLPSFLKGFLSSMMCNCRFSDITAAINVGNILAVGWKPHEVAP